MIIRTCRRVFPGGMEYLRQSLPVINVFMVTKKYLMIAFNSFIGELLFRIVLTLLVACFRGIGMSCASCSAAVEGIRVNVRL